MSAIARLVVLSTITATGWAQVAVTTGQYDNNRSGANLGETALNTSNVATGQFGLLFTRALDGYTFGQPLYVPALNIQGGLHNVVFVTTLNNSVYAFDADSPSASAPLWQTSLGTPFTITYGGQPALGILSTPVIDAAANAMYVVAATNENGMVYRIHELSLTTGAELVPSVVIQGGVPGTGDNSSRTACPSGRPQPCVQFVAGEHQQRAALLEANGVVYAGFGTFSPFEEVVPYHGWLFGYSSANLSQVSIFNTSPNNGGFLSQPPCSLSQNPCGHASGVWMSGRGPAFDGSVYLVTGNGGYGSNGNYGESVVRLGGSGQAADSFTPSNYGTLNANDLDFGAGGALLIPGTNLMLAIGKTGTGFVLNRSNLGGLTTGNTGAVQMFNAGPGCGQAATESTCYEVHHPVYWARSGASPLLYLWAWADYLRAFDLVNSQFVPDANPVGNISLPFYPGGQLALSANGGAAGSGILWAIAATNSSVPGPGVLYAFDAANITRQLWSSSADGTWNMTKFAIPTVVNGKVYVSTSSNQLRVYGLCTVATPCQTGQ